MTYARLGQCPECGCEFSLSDKLTIKKPCLIIAEGMDDKMFCMWACQAYKRKDIQVENYGGINNLKKFITALKTQENFETVKTLIIVRDAEDDATSAVTSIKGAFQEAEFPIPEKSYMFKSSGEKKSAFIIFPGPGENKGTLENLCLATLKRDDPILICTEQFLDCVRRQNNSFSHEHKNKLHSYLSGTNKYKGLKIGEAAKSGAWDWNNKVMKPFREIITKM